MKRDRKKNEVSNPVEREDPGVVDMRRGEAGPQRGGSEGREREENPEWWRGDGGQGEVQ